MNSLNGKLYLSLNRNLLGRLQRFRHDDRFMQSFLMALNNLE
jgi:hypothetical protein